MILRVRSSAGTWRITLVDEPAPSLSHLKAAVESAYGLPTSSQQFASDPTGKELLHSVRGSDNFSNGGGSDSSSSNECGGDCLLSELGLGHGDLVYLMGQVVKVAADQSVPARYTILPDSDDDQEADENQQDENVPLTLPSRDPPKVPSQAADVRAAPSGSSDAGSGGGDPTIAGATSSIRPAGSTWMARTDGDPAGFSSLAEESWNDAPMGAFAHDSSSVRAPDASQSERMVDAFPALSSELAAAIIAAAAEEEHLRGGSRSGITGGGSVADASSGEALLAAELQAVAGGFGENSALNNRESSWVDEMAAQLLARRAAANAESMDARLARLLQQGEADAEEAEAWAADALRDATQPFESGYGQNQNDHHHSNHRNLRNATSTSPSLVGGAYRSRPNSHALVSPPPQSQPHARASGLRPSPSSVDEDDDGVLPAKYGSSNSNCGGANNNYRPVIGSGNHSDRGHGNDDRLTEAIRLSLLASSSGSTAPPLEQPPHEPLALPRSASRRKRRDNDNVNEDGSYGARSIVPASIRDAAFVEPLDPWKQRQASVRQQADALLRRSTNTYRDAASSSSSTGSAMSVGTTRSSQLPPRVPSVRPQFTSEYLSAAAVSSCSESGVSGRLPVPMARRGDLASSAGSPPDRPSSSSRRPRTPLLATSGATNDAAADGTGVTIGMKNSRSDESALRGQGTTNTNIADAGGGGGWWQEDGTVSSSAAWAQAAAASSATATNRNSAAWEMRHNGVSGTGMRTATAATAQEDAAIVHALAASMIDHGVTARAAQRDQEALEAALQSSLMSGVASSVSTYAVRSMDSTNNATAVSNLPPPERSGYAHSVSNHEEDEEEALQRAIAESLN